MFSNTELYLKFNHDCHLIILITSPHELKDQLGHKYRLLGYQYCSLVGSLVINNNYSYMSAISHLGLPGRLYKPKIC